MRFMAFFLLFCGLTARADDLQEYFLLANVASSDINSVLLPGVDQCFNPSYSEQDAAAKQELANLAQEIQLDKNAIQSSLTTANVQNAINHLQAVIDGLNKRVSILCGTERECLEAGFAGSDDYPSCLPVNGDTHANSQYRTFEELVDNLPRMLSVLESNKF